MLIPAGFQEHRCPRKPDRGCVQEMKGAHGYPVVTAVIPTHNRGWVLAEAVDSVLAQDYPAIELIVVDDGSTDDTPERLSAFGGRIRVIRQERGGVSAARNRGIAAARGDYIAFLDSDDLWRPRKITAQVDFFRSHPAARICQTEESWIRRGRRVNPGQRHKKPSGSIFIASLALCLVSPSAVMIDRRLFDEVGLFDESLPACEDYDMWLRISWKYPVFLLDEDLTVKRGGHADQLSNSPGLDRYRIRSLLKIIDSGVLSVRRKEAAISTLKEKCRIYATGCRRRGRLQEAELYAEFSRRYD
jgi:glycosyltransferase involved in cell wall biosynthesis